MAVFEETPSREDYLDDTARLFCTITNSRIIDGHTEYILKVQRGYNKDNNWTIFKRYSEFVELHKNLKASYYDINLPPKKFFGNLDRQFIKERQQKLESYMNKVVEHIVLASSVHLKQFLDPENYNPSIQDSGFENASMTLRESDFHSLKPLSYIGWRFNKQYGTVKRYNERKEYVLTWISEHSSRRFLTDKELQSAFKVLVDLSHPYIMPIVNGNTHWKGTLVIRSCCTKGSLREWIYERTAFDSFLDKCRYRNERIILPSVQVSTICIQVLNALSYLHKKNIPYGNLHTGNIFFEDNVAKISDIENGILGLPSFYKRFLVENRKIQTLEDVDVYCFGHVLYEMAFGERLMSCFHDSERSDCYDNLRPILRLLLSSSMDIKLPSIDQLLSSNAFSSNSTKIKFKTPSNCKFSTIAKEAMMKCKKNIEEGLLKEQNELRKHRKYVRLQEEVEAFERYDIQIKEKRKSRKKSSQLGNSTQSSDQFENMSNASTRTSFSTDSSSPNCGCDKSNENETNNAPKISSDSPSSSPSIPKSNKSPSIPESNISPSIPESNNRSVFLQSIVNFNKGKLKKTNSNNIP